MSSETRKKAWRSSVSQPKTEAAVKSEGESVDCERRREQVSMTDMPRLYFPPIQLYLRDYNG